MNYELTAQGQKLLDEEPGGLEGRAAVRMHILYLIAIGGWPYPWAKEEVMEMQEVLEEDVAKEVKYLWQSGSIVQEDERTRIGRMNSMFGTEPWF